MLRMRDIASMCSGSSVVFKCPFCPCEFCCESDLELHLKTFGEIPHFRLWFCVHVLLEKDGSVAGVDAHGDWHWRSRRYIRSSTVRSCRKTLSERGLDFYED